MIHYRTFRNTDPPRIVDVWNECFTGRGAVTLRNSTPLERFVFAKPIFDPAGFIVAEEDNRLLGFTHAAVVQIEPEPAVGVICMLAVRPSHRKHGVGAELLSRAEQYMMEQGATKIYAGGHWPYNPFYLGLYGGCDSPGFLASDPNAEHFFLNHNYQVVQRTLVMQRRLDQPLRIVDARFAPHRQRFQLQVNYPRCLNGHWEELVLGYLEPMELLLEDKKTGAMVARSLVWEMESYGPRWNRSSIGIMGFEVEPRWQRQGVGKFLLSHVLRHAQEQCFELAEVHLKEDNQPAIQFLRSLAFEHVDTGQVFLRK